MAAHRLLIFAITGALVATVFARGFPDLRGREASPMPDTEPVPVITARVASGGPATTGALSAGGAGCEQPASASAASATAERIERGVAGLFIPRN